MGQKKLEELLISPKRNREQIAALGSRYGLVTPFTSLMVLESLGQYVQHGIEPPKTLPEMRAAYLQRVGEQQKQDQIARGNRIEEVVRLWDTRVKSWETNFPLPLPPKPPRSRPRSQGRR